MSKRNLSPLPTSIRKLEATCIQSHCQQGASHPAKSCSMIRSNIFSVPSSEGSAQ